MKKFLPRDFVKDARKRQSVSYNKRVELNEDFKFLWDKISQKTRYSVGFETQKLIDLASEKIKILSGKPKALWKEIKGGKAKTKKLIAARLISRHWV